VAGRAVFRVQRLASGAPPGERGIFGIIEIIDIFAWPET
jgi:hypothetical protein